MDDKRRFYVAGPMRGLPDLNYRQFNRWALLLRQMGYEVFNPAEQFEGDQGRELREYYKADFNAITDCTDILFLSGWENSSGARIEYLIAKDLGLTMWMADAEKLGGPAHPTYRSFEEQDHPVELVAGHIVRKGARQQVYGHPKDDFARTSKMMDALGISTAGDPKKVAMMMITLKLSRLVNTPDHHDSIVDLVGYAICLSMIVQAEKM